MHRFFSIMFLATWTTGVALAQESPEAATRKFISAIAEGSMDAALKVCAVDDYAPGLNFEAFIDDVKAFSTIGTPAPGTSDLYRQINRYERIGFLARQIKYFCFSFSGNPDVKTISEGKSAMVEDSRRIAQFVKDTDPAGLKNLKVKKFKLFRPDAGTRLKQGWDKQAKLYGALEMLDGAALLELNGKTYVLTLEFMRFKSGWKIYSLNSPLLDASTLVGAVPASECDFDSLGGEVKGALTAPIEQ